MRRRRRQTAGEAIIRAFVRSNVAVAESTARYQACARDGVRGMRKGWARREERRVRRERTAWAAPSTRRSVSQVRARSSGPSRGILAGSGFVCPHRVELANDRRAYRIKPAGTLPGYTCTARTERATRAPLYGVSPRLQEVKLPKEWRYPVATCRWRRE